MGTKCRNCGHEFTIVDEDLYVDGENDNAETLYHCSDCHNLLYSDDDWSELCIIGYDEVGEGEDEKPIYSDFYYYTTYQGEDE